MENSLGIPPFNQLFRFFETRSILFFQIVSIFGDSKDPSERLGTKITLPKNKWYNTIRRIIKDMNNLVYTGKDSVNFH